jgi:hypothetical protein
LLLQIENQEAIVMHHLSMAFLGLYW